MSSLWRINYLDMKNMLCFRCLVSYSHILHFPSAIYKEKMGKFSHFCCVKSPVNWSWVSFPLGCFAEPSILQFLCKIYMSAYCYTLHFSCTTVERYGLYLWEYNTRFLSSIIRLFLKFYTKKLKPTKIFRFLLVLKSLKHKNTSVNTLIYTLHLPTSRGTIDLPWCNLNIFNIHIQINCYSDCINLPSTTHSLRNLSQRREIRGKPHHSNIKTSRWLQFPSNFASIMTFSTSHWALQPRSVVFEGDSPPRYKYCLFAGNYNTVVLAYNHNNAGM